MDRALAWRLNLYRCSELDGSLLLGRIVRLTKDPFLIQALTQHCADEARHSALWAETIRSLGLPFIRIFKSYQSFYFETGNVPSRIEEILAITHVFEHRVDRTFRAELETPGYPARLKETFQIMIDDEQQHLNWIGKWLTEHPTGLEALSRYEQLDSTVFASLESYWDRPWEFYGLGEE